MKSKSPFKAKVDIFQGSTSTYRHPSTVIQPIVGAQVGAQIAKTASEVTVKAITAKSKKPKKQFDFKVGPKPEALTVPDYKGDLRSLGGYEERTIPGKQSTMKISDMNPKQLQWMKDKKNELGTEGYAKLKKELTKDTIQRRSYSLDDKGNKIFDDWTNSPNTMKGSPVKHDPGASPKDFFTKTAESFAAAAGNTIKSQANPTRGFMSDITARVNAIKSQGPARGGVSAEDFASGNYAKPADAIDATSADTFAPPPPNQVAETGSYSGGRDRILEMDSNPVINQSIGRDTNVASQLFGSGQRASMLAMKGSPMHAHTPTHGKKYKKGDLFDESDLDKLKTGYDIRHVSTIQEDKEGQFMTTLGDRETFRGNSSKTIDYPRPGAARDTIRPKIGRVFKKEN